MIEARDAVIAAKEAARAYLVDEDFMNLRLEEVELSEDEEYWLITLGYDVPTKKLHKTPLEKLLDTQEPNSELIYTRCYRQFPVDAETGEVQTMKLRQL